MPHAMKTAVARDNSVYRHVDDAVVQQRRLRVEIVQLSKPNSAASHVVAVAESQLPRERIAKRQVIQLKVCTSVECDH